MMEKLKSIKIYYLASYLGLFLLFTGTSWAFFTFVLSGGVSLQNGLSGLASKRDKIAELPKTEECSLNGGLFTKPEREIWEGRRPITAIIENHIDARPQSGIGSADIVYEFVAEGGITRFLSVFHCKASASDVLIAPVRSARIYFINLAAEYGDKPLFVHVGGANRLCGDCPQGLKPVGQVTPEVDAVGELVDLGWRVPRGNDFDTTYDSGFPVFWRNLERLGREVATEHTMMSSIDKIHEEAAKRGFTNDFEGHEWDAEFTPWKFQDDSPSSSVEINDISFEFWDNKPDYDVSWKYDSFTNSYLRTNAGVEHTDLETNEQLSTKNLVIQFVEERGPVDTEFHMFYEVIDTGEALIFQNGEVIEGSWEKPSQSGRTKFFDSQGKEILFVRGNIWITGVPIGNEIVYN